MIALHRRRLVRLHLADNQPSIEGILVGKPNGYYRLAQPTVLQGREESYEAEGEAWVPSRNILWVQVLG